MKCNKCGMEILDGNKFCTNCGKRVHRQNRKSCRKVKFACFLVSIVLSIIVISLVVFAIIKNNEKQSNDKENSSQTLEENKYKVEIGITYNYTEDDYIATLDFNTDKDFIIRSGYSNSDETMEIGTYTIDNNIIKLIVNYNSNNDYGKDDNPNYVDTPYNLELTILDNGNIYNGTITYIKESNSDTEEIETNNNSNSLLDQIYTKYPEFKDKEGYICTDGEQYWLLDSEGKKVYFDSIQSFDEIITNIEEANNTTIKFNIEKFIEELSYKSLSTVRDGVHGGDGYRSDYQFYNQGLTIDNFEINQNSNQVEYKLITNGNYQYHSQIILTIITTENGYLDEIKMTCNPVDKKAGIIIDCAMEVEDALGYTLFNLRNGDNIEKITNNLISKGCIDNKSKNLLKNTDIQEEAVNKENGEKSVFEYKNGVLSYTISFNEI